MTVLLIDPGLADLVGHNGAMFEEFAQEAATWSEGHLIVAAHTRFRPRTANQPRVTVRPMLQVHGYTPLGDAAHLDRQWLGTLVDQTERDLRGLDWGRVDSVLIPTMNPVLLLALARLAASLPRCSVALGLLIPVSFWVKEPSAQQWVGAQMREALAVLQRHTDLVLYSETGRYLLAGSQIETGTLLPPLRAELLGQMARDAGRVFAPGRPTTFGYFGAPFTSKGFVNVASAAHRADPARVQIRFRLPAGHGELCERLHAASAAIRAESGEMDNAAYLQAMAEVDVVLLWYDPNEYGSKMSGIVAEALALGKPVVVCNGCVPIIDFLDRYAPGSFIAGNYGVDELAAAFALPRELWSRLAERARASAPVVRELKSMSRYLSVCGVQTDRCLEPA